VAGVRLAYSQLKIGLFVVGSLLRRHRPEIWPQNTDNVGNRPTKGEARLTSEEVLLGERDAIRPTTGYVLSNPFGMSILDVGLIDAVYQSARHQGLGQQLSVY
jgi:N-[(2S)-2-amino-2-carboxyethyl]-L-glutamate dehydrogenase